MVASCVRCDEQKPIHSRGLCAGCRSWAMRCNQIETFAKTGRTAQLTYLSRKQDHGSRRSWDFTEDYLFVKSTYGGDHAAIATRLGITEGALKLRLYRRRQWGQL